MLFRRRIPLTRWERIRLWIWPKSSISRSLRYMGKRILRIAATPHSVALGLSIGIFLACTPFFGLHIFLALIIAWFARANVGAAAIGTAFSNPLTIPFLMGLDFVVGDYIFKFFGLFQHKTFDTEITLTNILDVWRDLSFSDAWQPIILPLLMGSVFIGVLFAAFSYICAYWTTSRYQKRRKERIALKAQTKLSNNILSKKNSLTKNNALERCI